MSTLVDTSAFLPLINPDDPDSELARRGWRALEERDEHLVTTNYVVLEAFALIVRRLGMEAVRAFESSIVPAVTVVWITPELHRIGVEAVLAAGRRKLSLVDTTSFAVMRERGIATAFALDDDFKEQGFTVIP